MKKKFFSILLALVLVCSFSLVTAVPVAAVAGDPITTLVIPDNVYRPAPFDVSGTTTNDGTAYTNVRFNITVDGPGVFTGLPSAIFSFDPDVQGIEGTFVLDEATGNFVGNWGPAGGFPVSDSYNQTSVFTIQMTGDAPLGDYNITVGLVLLDETAIGTDGTASFSLSADTLYVGAGQQFTTIQDAIDAASAGDTISVAAGAYDEEVIINKNNLTLESVGGAEVTTITASSAVATVDFIGPGSSVVTGSVLDGFTVINEFMDGGYPVVVRLQEADGCTVKNSIIMGPSIEDAVHMSGALVSGQHGPGVNNIIEYSTMTNCWNGVVVFAPQSVGNIVKKNTIVGNSNGVVVEWEASNTLVNSNNIYDNIIVNLITDVAGPVDATNNWWGSALESEVQAMVSGNVDFMPWYATETTTPERQNVTVKVGDTVDVRAYSDTIQGGIDAASPGDTINVAAGTYSEGITGIAKDLTIIGATAPSKPIINPTADTGTDNAIGPTGRGWFQVTEATVDFENLVFDGIGKLVHTAVHYHGDSTGGAVESCDFMNIAHTPAGYQGRGINNYGQHVEVLNCTFSDILRIGVFTFNPTATTLISGCTYTGKGDGDWLDYAFEAGNGGEITVEGGCTVTDCRGVVDVWTSAGILVTTAYGPGTQATITGNDIYNNSGGIAVGYDEKDTSVVVAHYNNIVGNTDYGIDSTAPSVDALYNYWGDEAGPEHATLNPGAQGDAVSDNVIFSPWLYKTQEEFISGAPCYAGSVVLGNEATEVGEGETLSWKGGWNSFSTPVTLDDSADSVSELLDLTADSGLFIVRAQRFDPSTQKWVDLVMGGDLTGDDYQIKPGEGFFIQVEKKGSLPILCSTNPILPPRTDLVAGWNLVGLSDFTEMTVASALHNVDYSVVISPSPPNAALWSVPSPDDSEIMELGEAYWLGMSQPGILFGHTTIPVADDMTWGLNQN